MKEFQDYRRGEENGGKLTAEEMIGGPSGPESLIEHLDCGNERSLLAIDYVNEVYRSKDSRVSGLDPAFQNSDNFAYKTQRCLVESDEQLAHADVYV
ncbi:hypothetical protein BELL_0548g00050 [Botrytis elliptica]|uniref:Uncharacterized protein n=1 Tax=Botrytis elliptica TaxID=278938 RepID=A0A4Z1JDL9_9HELO|nr:hypothetical protein BELL_0548g00050 [Botrytis elliptica]